MMDGLAVFLVRGGADVDFHRDVVRYLERRGFELIHRQEVEARHRPSIAAALESFSWAGLDPVSSPKEVSSFVIAFDVDPRVPKPDQLRRFPGARNKRLLSVLFSPRTNHRVPGDPRLLQSTVAPDEARACMALLVDSDADAIERRIEQVEVHYRTSYPVLQRLDKYGFRGKVELIEYHGGRAVLKTWRPSQRRFWRNEVRGMSALRHVSAIPPVLDSGQYWLIKPYYQDVLDHSGSGRRFIPLKIAREAVEALREVHEAGYFLQDFTPDNIVVDRAEGVKFVDLEFLQRYRGERPAFVRSYSLVGLPADFAGDVVGVSDRTYQSRWEPLVGVSLDTLLNQPYAVQRIKRWEHRGRAIARKVRRRLRGDLGSLTRTTPQ